MWLRSTDRCSGVLVVALLCACPGSDDDDGAGPSTGSESSSGAVDSSSTSESSSEASSSEGSTGEVVIDYATMIQPIWNSACTCHLQGPSGTMTATVLTLNEDVSYSNLVYVASEQAPQLDRIVPNDSAASYLWRKLQGTQVEAGGSGTAMPQIGELTEEQLQLIQDWILAGAMP